MSLAVPPDSNEPEMTMLATVPDATVVTAGTEIVSAEDIVTADMATIAAAKSVVRRDVVIRGTANILRLWLEVC